MPAQIFEQIAEKIEARGDVGAINFSGMGEPTLNPALPSFIERFQGGHDVYITTNGSTLTEPYISKLLAAGLRNMFVSFNGADRQTYESMMGGLDFTRISQRLGKLVELGRGRLSIIVNVSVTKRNDFQLAEIRQHLAELGIGTVFFSLAHSRGGYLQDESICATPAPPPGMKRCDIFAETLFIAANGDVLACCHDLQGTAKIGNLVEQDFDEVLAVKERIMRDGGVDFDICRQCRDIYRFMHAPLPGGRALSSWIYARYTTDERGIGWLLELLRQGRARGSGEQDQNRFYEWLEAIIRQKSGAGSP